MNMQLNFNEMMAGTMEKESLQPSDNFLKNVL
jgi:hypothetical protein